MTTAHLPWSARLVLPYTRRELPGWGKLLKLLVEPGANPDRRFQGLPPVTIRGKWHGYRMTLNLGDWAERRTWFLGRYYEMATQLLLRQVLQPGDRFIDVGANIGMISLLAARLVTPRGRVDAFEPNPVCADRLRESMAANGIDHVFTHQVALGPETSSAILSVVSEHTGTATIANVPEADRGLVSNQYDVQVLPADDVIEPELGPAALVKIDVEGFECGVITGMMRTLKRDHPLVMTEVVEQWLTRAGSSPARLHEQMRSLGYRPLALSVRRQSLFRYGLDLRPLTSLDQLAVTDVVWMQEGHAEHRRRLGL